LEWEGVSASKGEDKWQENSAGVVEGSGGENEVYSIIEKKGSGKLAKTRMSKEGGG